MKKIIIFSTILLSVVIISGCINQTTCNPPYILVGTECCLDVNDNKICDDDETTTVATTSATTITTTTRTTIPTTAMETTTTIYQRVGALDVRSDFFIVCQKSSQMDEWCSIENNEVTVETASLGAQEHNLVEIATWVSNKGSADVTNINYEISCDQTYPAYESKVITGTNDKYKTIIPTIYFRCQGCLKGCSCTPGTLGQTINTMRFGDETTFRIELFGVRDIPEKIDLDCDVKIYSEDPKSEYNLNFIIHFNV